MDDQESKEAKSPPPHNPSIPASGRIVSLSLKAPTSTEEEWLPMPPSGTSHKSGGKKSKIFVWLGVGLFLGIGVLTYFFVLKEPELQTKLDVDAQSSDQFTSLKIESGGSGNIHDREKDDKLVIARIDPDENVPKILQKTEPQLVSINVPNDSPASATGELSIPIVQPGKEAAISTAPKSTWESPTKRKIAGAIQANGIFLADNTPSFKHFESHFVPPPKEARGVLVLCLNPRSPKLTNEHQAWMQFAEAEKFALASIGYEVQPKLRDTMAVGREFSKLLDMALEAKFGPGRKRIAFAQGDGTQWLLRAIHEKQENWLFWAVKGCRSYPKVFQTLKGQKFPPGMVLSTVPEFHLEAQDYFMELRRLNQRENRVTLVRSDEDTLDAGFQVRFFRQYVSSVYNNLVSGGGFWYHIHSEAPPAAGKDPWIHHSWVPNGEIAGAWRILNQEMPTLKESLVEKSEFDSPAGRQTVWVRTPGALLEKDTKAKARPLILWLTRAKSTEDAEKAARDSGDAVLKFADANRLPVVVWNGQEIWSNIDSQADAKTDKNTVAKADQAFIKVGDAMIKQIRSLCREKGWPDGGWMLSADSCMGRYGLMLAKAYPFQAVQLHSAYGYEEFQPVVKEPWMVTSGWGDATAVETLRFSRSARSANWPVIYKRFPAISHGKRWDERLLAAEFFSHVHGLREGGVAKLLWSHDWDKPPIPEQFQAKPGAKEGDPPIQPVIPPDFNWGNYAPPRPKPQTIGDWFAEECRRKYLVGDWRNLQLVEADDSKWIHPWRSVNLPSRKIAEAWGATPVPLPELSEKEREEEIKHRANISGGQK